MTCTEHVQRDYRFFQIRFLRTGRNLSLQDFRLECDDLVLDVCFAQPSPDPRRLRVRYTLTVLMCGTRIGILRKVALTGDVPQTRWVSRHWKQRWFCCSGWHYSWRPRQHPVSPQRPWSPPGSPPLSWLYALRRIHFQRAGLHPGLHLTEEMSFHSTVQKRVCTWTEQDDSQVLRFSTWTILLQEVTEIQQISMHND